MKFALAIPERFRSKAKVPQRRLKSNGVSPLLMIAFLLLALFLGMVGGMDSPALVVIVAGAMFASLLFFMIGFQTLFFVLIAVTFVIQGSLMYFAGLRSATWVAVGMAMMFFFRLLLELVLRAVPRADLVPDHRNGTTAFIAAGFFVLCFFVSIVLNKVPVTQIVSSSKAMLPMFGVLFAMFWVRWGERVNTLWRYATIIMLIQLPVVAVQHFIYAVNRNFDSVVGTFGGTPGAGGNSAVMVLFTIIVMAYTASRWNQGLISFKTMAWMSIVGIVIILLGEVKASFIWLPLAMFWVLRKRILRNLTSAIFYTIFVSLFILGTYKVYNILYWGETLDRASTVTEKLDAGGGYFFDPNNVNYRTGEISRGASVAIWYKDPIANMPKRLLGYGPGASRPAGLLGAGSVAIRYAPLHLDASALAVLLWDTGVLGAMSYAAMMLLGCGIAWRYAARTDLTPQRRALADTCVVALLIQLMLLIYNRALMDEPTAQLLLMMCLGTVLQITRFDPKPTGKK